MTNIEICKGKGIEGLVRATQIDESRELTAEPGLFEEVDEAYQAAFEGWMNVETRVLTPDQINQFLQTTIRYEKHQDYAVKTGKFISKLIQTSYDAGHDIFNLNVPSKLDYLCSYLKTYKRPLHITTSGDLGRSFGIESVGVNFMTSGSPTDYCGDTARDCSFTIRGDVGDQCGVRSNGSSFMIAGDANHRLGMRSRESRFHVEGEVADDCGVYARLSTFSTPYSDTLAKMVKDVPILNEVVHVRDKERSIMRPWKYVTTAVYGWKEFLLIE